MRPDTAVRCSELVRNRFRKPAPARACRFESCPHRSVGNSYDRDMFAKLYLMATGIFFAIDMVWLGLVAKDFYQKQIGFLLSKEVNWIAAIIFYLIFILGLVVFVITPALNDGDWKKALLMGALFGVVCYATYDLTNLATMKGWPLMVTIVDLVWGGVLSGSVSVLTVLLAKKIGL